MQSEAKIDGPVKLFTDSLDTYKKHWKILVLFFCIPTVLFALSSIIKSSGSVSSVNMSVLFSLLGMVISLVMYPTGILVLSKTSQSDDSSLSFFSIFKAGLAFFLPMIFIYILSIFIFIGSAIFFIVPGIVVGLYSSFFMYALVLDGKKGFASFEESFILIGDRIFGVVGRILFSILIIIGASIIITGLHYILGVMMGIPNPLGVVIGNKLPEPDVARTFLAAGISIVSSLFVAPFTAIYSYRLYASLKSVRRADVSTKSFNVFLKVFMIIGILVTVLAMLFIPMIISKSSSMLKQKLMNPTQSIGASVIESSLFFNQDK